MRIALDISPLQTGHRVRGTGFYVENLKTSLLKYYPENKYIYFTRGDNLPRNVDLVHYPYFDPFFITLPFFSQYKTVVTVHDLTPLVFSQEFPVGVKGFLKWQIQKFLLKKADAIITDSISSKKDIIKYVGINENKIRVVYLAAGSEFKVSDHRSSILDLKSKYKLPQKFVLYVGDVTWNKNLPRLVEAAVRANLPLIMVGKALLDIENIDIANPWNKDLVKTINYAQRHKNIFRLGFIDNEDLVALYNLAAVFVMPSLYEGFGLPILEAMSCGCPVITSKEGSLPEVAGEAAFYVDAYSVESIATGIREVFNNRKLQQELAEKGLIQASKFSWQKTAAQTIAFYEKVLEEK